MIWQILIGQSVANRYKAWYVTPKSPPPIGPAVPNLEKIAKIDYLDQFCCQNRSGRTNFDSQNWSSFANFGPPVKINLQQSKYR